MSVTLANLITNLNTYLGDTTTDRIADVERYEALTEATVWLQEELGNDHMISTSDINYYDTLNYYKITSSVPDLLETADLRRAVGDNTVSFSTKSSREMSEEIANGSQESAFGIERRDADTYLVINHNSKYIANSIASFDSTTADGGTWVADTTNSDATNVTADTNEFTQGAGSLNFDITVAQSGNNRATISNTAVNSKDLSDYENLAAFLIDVYIPDTTYFSSVTLYWGSSSSAYWSLTATTDASGGTMVSGWNTLKFTWSSATKTSTPTASAINYYRIDINYSASQGNATDFRIDNLRVVRPEVLKLYYQAWIVGTNNSGTSITAFTATNDVPFFSAKYDQYKYAVAHQAASILFYSALRMLNQGSSEEKAAIKALDRARKIIPQSITKEVKSFKIVGNNLRLRRRRG